MRCRRQAEAYHLRFQGCRSLLRKVAGRFAPLAVDEIRGDGVSGSSQRGQSKTYALSISSGSAVAGNYGVN